MSLRDALNLITWDNSLENHESAALVRLTRLYARAHSDARDGILINRTYFISTGLGDLIDTLAAVFKAELVRRSNGLPASAIDEQLALITERMTRAELEEDEASAEAAEAKKIDRKGKGKEKA